MKKTLAITCFAAIIMLHATILKAQISVTANTDSIGRYDVYELTIQHPQSYNNNWEDVTIDVAFTGPQTIHISGFFYDTHTWKVRYATPMTGNWKYAMTFTTPLASYTYTDSFTCIASGTKGFLQKHPSNPFRLIYADGTLFNAIGLEDCILDMNQNGTTQDDWGFDGNLRTGDYKGSYTSLDNYMSAYGSKGAGFNLFRWTTFNCSFGLYNTISPAGNTYFGLFGMWGDTLVQSLRRNDIRILMTFFGAPVFKDMNGSTPLEEAALKRYINYVVARYGAYIDIWELFNENSATDYWINMVSGYLKSIDPYHRLVSVSDPRPDLSSIDVNSPHWYEKEPELTSDYRAWDMITTKKSWNKPIIFGEQGNSVQNWDLLSALRMRIRSWTAFFAEGIFIFWNTSVVKDYLHNYAANIYLGPEERGYIRAMQNFTSLADSSVTTLSITPSNFSEVRGYGLRSPERILAYFHHYTSHESNVTTSFNYRMRKAGTIYWINPADNTVIKTGHLSRGAQTITSPSFNIDIAMHIDIDTSASPVDINDKLDILIYPNPATSEFIIEGNFAETAVVELYDETGKKVMSKRGITNSGKVSLPGIAPGIYIYKITADTRQATGKIVVQ